MIKDNRLFFIVTDLPGFSDWKKARWDDANQICGFFIYDAFERMFRKGRFVPPLIQLRRICVGF
jgi:hypothetical protein